MTLDPDQTQAIRKFAAAVIQQAVRDALQLDGQPFALAVDACAFLLYDCELWLDALGLDFQPWELLKMDPRKAERAIKRFDYNHELRANAKKSRRANAPANT